MECESTYPGDYPLRWVTRARMIHWFLSRSNGCELATILSSLPLMQVYLLAAVNGAFTIFLFFAFTITGSLTDLSGFEVRPNMTTTSTDMPPAVVFRNVLDVMGTTFWKGS